MGNVEKYKYLGSQIQYNQTNTGDTELSSRINMAESKFYQQGMKFMNRKIKLSIRVSILNSLVRSRLTYGCQTWTLDKRQTDKISSVYVTMLRKMIRKGFERREGEWALQYSNQQILNICKTESIEDFVLRQKRQYLAHVIRLPDTAITKRIAFNDTTTQIPGRRITFLDSTLMETPISQFAREARLRTA